MPRIFTFLHRSSLFSSSRSGLFHEPPLSPRSILDVCAEDVHRVLKRVSSIDKDDEWQQKGEALRRSGSLYLCALHVVLLLWWPPSKFVANCWHLWSPDCKIKGKHHYIITNNYNKYSIYLYNLSICFPGWCSFPKLLTGSPFQETPFWHPNAKA